MKMTRLALTWFCASDWERWCALDENFEPSFDRWLARAQAAERDLQAAGVTVVRVTLDPDVFRTWAREHAGGDVGGSSRNMYAALLAMEQEPKEPPPRTFSVVAYLVESMHCAGYDLSLGPDGTVRVTPPCPVLQAEVERHHDALRDMLRDASAIERIVRGH